MKHQLKQLKARSRKLSLKQKMLNLSDNEIVLNLKKTSDGFLRSNEWKALRLKALELYGYVCIKCKRDNSREYPINVDHIKPRKFFPELALEITNLQPMCGPCNKKKGNKY
jgi:5-methylcytosine-specific restriction endonuclease McrA